MDNSILIGKYIRDLLLGDERLANYLQPKQINALVIVDDKTPFPFITFGRTALVPKYTKDGLLESDVTFEIQCVSKDYIESLEIANIIRNLLEAKSYTDEGIFIRQILLTGAIEDFMYNAYVQRLVFSMTVR